MKPASAPPHSFPDDHGPPSARVRHTRTYEVTTTARHWENWFEAKASLRTVPLDPFSPPRQHASIHPTTYRLGEDEP